MAFAVGGRFLQLDVADASAICLVLFWSTVKVLGAPRVIRYRLLFILAIGSAFSVQTLRAQDLDSVPRDPVPQDDAPLETLPLPLPVQIIEDQATADARARREAEAVEREIRDLAAQEGMNQASQAMNDATQLMACYTLWSTLVGAFGVLLLVWTLRESRRATRAATDMLRLEATPFLSVEIIDGSRVRFKDGRWGKMDGDAFHPEPVTCRIVNGGRSTAVTFRYFRCWDYTCKDGCPDVIDPEAEDEALNKLGVSGRLNDPFHMPVGPQGASPTIATFSEALPAPGPENWVYFYGFLEFAEPSGRLRGRIGFCFVYAPEYKERGFHVAFPENRDKYWYYEELPRVPGSKASKISPISSSRATRP
ncbi:hypothetical protein [Xinfangfangia pollutisoli]|uniref:hypothetical protein n=1 Tax=Xinfangfangia pollutisoli TaxID=2865960 RepID=UPI001CD202A5|nr:hypothetical protein [Xinfangfangia pollutisoli]